MTNSFDLIIKNGTVVNHDGTGMRDIGVRGGRIAHIGALADSAAAETIDARACTSCPA